MVDAAPEQADLTPAAPTNGVAPKRDAVRHGVEAIVRREWHSPFESRVPLHTDEQARTAVITMVPHLYGISGVYAGFGGYREGNTWHVPLVYHRFAKGPISGEAAIADFAKATPVGEVVLHADTAELLRCSGRDEVESNVCSLLRDAHPDAEPTIDVSPPVLELPVHNHEVAWRYAMHWFHLKRLPTSVVAGTPVRHASGSYWVVPIFVASPQTGEKVWNDALKVDAHSGLVFDAPTDEAMRGAGL